MCCAVAGSGSAAGGLTESRKRPLETDAGDVEAGTAAVKAKPNDAEPGDASAPAAPVEGDSDATNAAGAPAEADAKAEPADGAASDSASAKDEAKGVAPNSDEAEKAIVEAKEPAPQMPTAYALKLLVSNNSAGSIIGKGGQTINMMQQQSMATIKVSAPCSPAFSPAPSCIQLTRLVWALTLQLSQNGETFPGSEYRVVLITHAEMQPVLTAVSLLLQKVAEEDPTSTTIDGRFTVPDGAAADVIHGEGGEMLQSIMQQTLSQMALAQNPFTEGACERDPYERVLTISGSLEAIIGAVASVLTEMQKVPAQGQDGRMFKNMSTNYGSGVKGGMGMRGGMTGGGMGMGMGMGVGMGMGMGMGMRGGYGGMGGGMGMGAGGRQKTAQVLQVPDQMIGAIVGRAGQTINEIMQTTQTRVQISQKGEYIPGTRNRQVTVTGTPETIQYATSIITQKLQDEASRTGQVLPDLITGMPSDGSAGVMGAVAGYGGMQVGYSQAGYAPQASYGHGGYGQQMDAGQQQQQQGYYGQQQQQQMQAWQGQQQHQQPMGTGQQDTWAQQGGQQQGYGMQQAAVQGGQQQQQQPQQQQQWPQQAGAAGMQQHAQGMQHGYGQQQQPQQQAGYGQQQQMQGQQQQQWQVGMQQQQAQPQMGAVQGYQGGYR